MSPRSDGQRLEDILAAIQTIEDHQLRGQVLGLSPEEPLLLDAVVRQLAVIGEAASHLPADPCSRLADTSPIAHTSSDAEVLEFSEV